MSSGSIKHARFGLELRGSTSLSSTYAHAVEAREPEGEDGFGTSSAVAAHNDFLDPHELRIVLTQFCADRGIEDEQSIESLVRNRVSYSELIEFWKKRRLFVPHPKRDFLGEGAAALMAAEGLSHLLDFEDVLADALGPNSLVERVMREGAEGLFRLGRDQFKALAQMAVELVDWLTREGPQSVVLVEAPLGNSVPVAVIQKVAEARGRALAVFEWGCPRNDRALRGRTVADSACDLATDPIVASADLVLFVDDAITGSRFLKMARALRKAVGSDRFGAIAIRVRFNPSANFATGQLRDLRAIRAWAGEIGLPFGEVTFPDLPLFQINDDGRHLLESASAWGDSSLTAGKRKSNLVFVFIDRFEAIAAQLGMPSPSAARTVLMERVWAEDTDGQLFFTPPDTVEAHWFRIIGGLPHDFFDQLRAEARRVFPHDFYGRRVSGKSEFRRRTDWLADCVGSLARQFIGERDAMFLNRAVQDLSHSGFGAGVEKPPRDHNYGLYTVPLPKGEDILHTTLVGLIVNEATAISSGTGREAGS